MTVKYTIIEKDNDKNIFYASIVDDSLLIISKKNVVCCANGFNELQANKLIEIHYSNFITGQKSDIEECVQPK
jgi:hypothetical protein